VSDDDDDDDDDDEDETDEECLFLAEVDGLMRANSSGNSNAMASQVSAMRGAVV
jgi:hypothetical protein